MSAPDSSTLQRNVHQARALLSNLTEQLAAYPQAESASEEIREASSALAHAESAPLNAQAVYLRVRSAIGHLARALSALESEHADPALIDVCEAVARALALLYPVARAHQRQRREVMLNPSLAPPPSDAGDRRTEPRVLVEADVGLLSQTRFFTGLTRDLSRGGLFVATYQPKPPGTEVALHFVLPDGHAVHADGVVAWTAEASADSPPGMGIRFTQLSADDVAAVERFCVERAPLLIGPIGSLPDRR